MEAIWALRLWGLLSPVLYGSWGCPSLLCSSPVPRSQTRGTLTNLTQEEGFLHLPRQGLGQGEGCPQAEPGALPGSSPPVARKQLPHSPGLPGTQMGSDHRLCPEAVCPAKCIYNLWSSQLGDVWMHRCQKGVSKSLGVGLRALAQELPS